MKLPSFCETVMNNAHPASERNDLMTDGKVTRMIQILVGSILTLVTVDKKLSLHLTDFVSKDFRHKFSFFNKFIQTTHPLIKAKSDKHDESFLSISLNHVTIIVYNCMPFLKIYFKTSPWWCPRETSNLYTLSLLVGYHSVRTPLPLPAGAIELPTKFSERGDMTYRISVFRVGLLGKRGLLFGWWWEGVVVFT